MTAYDAAPMDDVRTAEEVERIFFELRKVIVGQSRLLERLLVGLLRPRPLPARVGARPGQDARRRDARRRRRRHVRPHPVHARPAAVRHRRHPHLPRQQRDASTSSSARCSSTSCSPTRSTGRPAKVQSALLEVMAEHQVTIGGITHPVPDPFFVVATQNPIESEGVYQLPDAQRDRFMMKIVLDHPTAARGDGDPRPHGGQPAGRRSRSSTSTGSIDAAAHAADAVFVDRSVAQYAVDLVQATRHPDAFGLGDLRRRSASAPARGPRLTLVRGARALALHPRPHVRHAAGRVRRRPRGAAPPPAAHLRRAGPRHHRRHDRQPDPRDGAGDVGVAEAERRRSAPSRWPAARRRAEPRTLERRPASTGRPDRRPSRSPSSCARSS